MVKQAAKAVPAWQRLKEAWATDRLGVLGSAAATLSGILFSIPRGYFKDFPHAAPQYFTFRHGWCYEGWWADNYLSPGFYFSPSPKWAAAAELNCGTWFGGGFLPLAGLFAGAAVMLLLLRRR